MARAMASDLTDSCRRTKRPKRELARYSPACDTAVCIAGTVGKAGGTRYDAARSRSHPHPHEPHRAARSAMPQ